jgi:hypothetical protein
MVSGRLRSGQHYQVMGPDQVLMAGDVHGNVARLGELLEVCGDEGCSHLLQVGDFGWFPNIRAGREFIDAVRGLAERADVLVCFIGGNHDDWEDLAGLEAGGDRDEDGLVVLGTHLRYVPRPHRWVWGSCRFGALGGAWSIDRRRRVPFISWWPDEEPTEDQAERLCAAGELDVLVVHDAPGELDLSDFSMSGSDLGGGVGVRALIDMVVDRTRPEVVVHGHWHLGHDSTLGSSSRCVGLGDDRGPLSDQYVVLDTTDGSVAHTSHRRVALRSPLWRQVR